ncbi:MAG: hypothetical protein ABSF25_09835 [Bryobacteraceae bacterium]|jgi:hypothetical protein
MDAVDALVLAFLALADLALIAHLRRLRLRRAQVRRMMRSLRFAIQHETFAAAAVPRKRHLLRAG